MKSLLKSIWILSSLLAMVSCRKEVQDEDLTGAWKIIEVRWQENQISNNILGADVILLGSDGQYEFQGDGMLPGEWLINGERLRLHTPVVKDLNGHEIYPGHDSEWRIMTSKEYMVWRGTSRFENQRLMVVFQKTRDDGMLKDG